MRRAFRYAALAALPLLTLVAAVPAHADGGASIDHVERHGSTLQLLVSVPGDRPVDLASVTATVGGLQARTRAEDASIAARIRRTTVLAIDTSDSMRGARITGARTAALAYLASVPADVRVGIVGFAGTVDQVLAPTTDRAAARAALGRLRLSRGTSLYDGVAAAIAATGTSGQRDLLLLSDGKDTTGSPLAGLLDRVRHAGVKVDAVSLAAADAENPALRQITGAGHGQVLTENDPAALAGTFAGEARVLGRQVLVTLTVPATTTASDATVAVSLSAGGTSYTGSAYVNVGAGAQRPAPTAQRPEPVSTSALAVPQPVVLGAIAAIGLALLVLVAGLLRPETAGGRSSSLEEQLSAYGASAGRGPGQRRAPRESISLKDQARDAAARALASNRSLEARIERRLDAAGVAFKPAEWLLLHGAVAVGAGILGGLLGAGSPVLIVLLLALGVVGPWLYLGIRRSRRLAAFDSHLPDTLQLMSGSLSAGLSLGQSLDTIVREGAEPVCSEFRRVIVESRLGVELEDALEGVATRMDSKDFTWVVMAIRIQRQVGGNLAELLLTVAATLREREYLRRHVRALSAEGRLSCWILGALPPVFLLYLALSKPDYVHPMFTTPLGLLMCVAMSVLLGVGVFWMSKVAKVEL